MSISKYQDQTIDVSGYKSFTDAKQATYNKFKDNPEFSEATKNPKALKYIYALVVDGAAYTVGKNESSADRGKTLFSDTFQMVHNKYPINRLLMLNAKNSGADVKKYIILPKNSDIQNVNTDKLSNFELQVQKDLNFKDIGLDKKLKNSEVLEKLVLDRAKALKTAGVPNANKYLALKPIQYMLSVIGGMAYTEIDNLRAGILNLPTADTVITDPNPDPKKDWIVGRLEGETDKDILTRTFEMIFGYRVDSNKDQKTSDAGVTSTRFKPGETDNIDVDNLPKQLSLFEILKEVVLK